MLVFVYELVLCVGGVLLLVRLYYIVSSNVAIICVLFFICFVCSYGEFVAYIVCILTVLFCAVVS